MESDTEEYLPKETRDYIKQQLGNPDVQQHLKKNRMMPEVGGLVAENSE